MLRALARHAVTVPLAETDVLACWLATAGGIDVPPSGPLTVAAGRGERSGGRIIAEVRSVPYAADGCAVVLALRDGERLLVAWPAIRRRCRSSGGTTPAASRATRSRSICATTSSPRSTSPRNCIRRGAWARCMQIIGALDAAVEFSVAHTREREQFGRPLSAFQAVQHTLAGMAGEVERARAAANLAVDRRCGLRFRQPADRLRRHRRQGDPRPGGSAGGHRRPPVARRDRRDLRTPAVAGDHAGPQHGSSEFGDTAHYAQSAWPDGTGGADPWDVIIGNIGD